MRLAVMLIVLAAVPAALAQQVTPPTLSVFPEQAHVTLAEDGSGLVIQVAVPAPVPEAATMLLEHNGETTEMQVAGFVAESLLGLTSLGTQVYAVTVAAAPGDKLTYRTGYLDPALSPTPFWTQTFTVAMPPAVNDSIRFVAMGDVGSDGVGPDGQQVATADESKPIEVRDAAIAHDPDLVIIPGDLSYTNSRGGWDRFMRMYEPLQANVPVMPVIGNHEWNDDEPEYGYSRFFENYVLPGNEEDFLFRAGPVTFIGVNSDGICTGDAYRTSYGHRAEPCPVGEPDGERRDRLEAMLQEAVADDTPWTVVFMHHPTYSWGRHGSDIGQQILWGPLFEEYEVDLVVTGHDHLYSRSYPVIQGQKMAGGSNYTQGTAPVYVVTGGGGRSLYDLPDPAEEPRPAWHAAGESVHHVSVFDVSPERVSFQAVRLDGSIMDSFSIAATASPDGEAAPGLPLLAALATLAAASIAARRRWD